MQIIGAAGFYPDVVRQKPRTKDQDWLLLSLFHPFQQMSTFVSTNSLAPVLFLSHGAGPAAFLDYKGSRFHDLDRTSPSASFMRNLQDVISQEYRIEDIKSIIVVSAHWEEPIVTVDYQTGPTTLLYDYYNFPAESYAPHLTYPVPTDVNLAKEVHEIFNQNGIKNDLRRRNGGFDHGVFIPLKLAFPRANIPVVQVSLHNSLDIETHIRLGEALAPLRQEGVLIIGSGQITHSDGSKHRLAPGETDPRCVEFTDWVKGLLEGTNERNYEERRQTLVAAPQLAPHFAVQHPRTEHFVPLAVAFGASKPQPTVPVSISATETTSEVDSTGESTTSALETTPSDTTEQSLLSIRRVFHHIAMGRMATDAYVFSSAAK